MTDSRRTLATTPAETQHEALMKRWLLARQRRAAAEPGSKDYVAAAEEITAIEVEIARVGRAANPPLV
jgi:hypothetical protein